VQKKKQKKKKKKKKMRVWLPWPTQSGDELFEIEHSYVEFYPSDFSNRGTTVSTREKEEIKKQTHRQTEREIKIGFS